MNDDLFNMEVRKFLKQLGVTAQREIEEAVRRALAEGRIQGSEALDAAAKVDIPQIDLSHEVKGTIKLD
ncbi:MAG: DUF6494 family protein [Alphaproteobacteria bacterium]